MSPTHMDYAMTSLCLWREARGEQQVGMTAVACVIRNRVMKNNSDYLSEVTKKWAFSSMTDPNDKQLTLYPKTHDPLWITAQLATQTVIDGDSSDITSGATLYWNPDGIQSTKTYTLPDGTVVKFPQSWNPAVVQFAVKIGNHIFLREI